jgi:glycosyltransferase involved in cell wall biosynthesis
MKQIGKYLKDKILAIFSYYVFLKRQKALLKDKIKITEICLLYYIPVENKEKYTNWEDGFTKAMKLLENQYNITWINLYDRRPSVDELNDYDFLIVKSCWNWIVDKYVRGLNNLETRRGIVISCSIKPKKEWTWYYDVLWYETEWYKKEINFFKNKFLAFGINDDVFKPMSLEKKYDVLSIGALTSYKRFEKLNDLEGNKKIIIGTINTNDFEVVKSKLDKSIEIIDYLSQAELAKYINESKLIYIPSELQGGGERAVLEAMACGVEVKVEEDNYKLKSLLEKGKPMLIEDYYNGLLKGLQLFENK